MGARGRASGVLYVPLALALAAPPAPAAAPSLLVLDLVAVEVPASVPRLLSGLLADSVARHSGAKTLAQEDLRQAMALQANKEALGCDTATCLAEMANALGVDYVVYGDVGKLGNATIVTLRLYDAKKNDAVARQTLQAASVEDARKGLDGAVEALLAPVRTRVAAAGSAGTSPLLWPGVVCGAVGALVAAGAGAYALTLDATLGDKAAAPAARDDAYGVEPWALVGASAGAAIALVGGGLVGASLFGAGGP